MKRLCDLSVTANGGFGVAVKGILPDEMAALKPCAIRLGSEIEREILSCECANVDSVV